MGSFYWTITSLLRRYMWYPDIVFVREEDKRKLYQTTELGEEILALALQRIERLYRNSRGEIYDE